MNEERIGDNPHEKEEKRDEIEMNTLMCWNSVRWESTEVEDESPTDDRNEAMYLKTLDKGLVKDASQRSNLCNDWKPDEFSRDRTIQERNSSVVR